MREQASLLEEKIHPVMVFLMVFYCFYCMFFDLFSIANADR